MDMAEEFGAVEKVMTEFQKEVTKEENTRLLKLLDLLKPEIKREPQSHDAEEEVNPGQRLCEQEWTISLGQKNPQPTIFIQEQENPAATLVKEKQENPETTLVKEEEENPEPTLVKEEQEEICATQEEEQRPGLYFILTSPCVKTDLDEVLPQPTHLYQTQTVENRERTPWDSQHTNAVQIKTEPDGESYGGPGPTSESSGSLQSVLKPLKPEIKREPKSHEEEVSLHQQLCGQECKISLDQENLDPTLVKEEPENPETILVKEEQENPEPTLVKEEQKNPESSLVKEEQDEIWDSQLPGLASDTEDFIMTSPCVKTDFDQVLPQPQIKTEPEGEGYGGPGPTGVSLLLSDSTDRVESSGLLQSVLNPLNPRSSKRKKKQIFPVSAKDRNSTELWEPLPSHTGESSHRHVDFNTQGQHCESDVYNKSVNQKEQLISHLVIHTGDTPFKCEECGKCFNTKRNLNSHMKIHTGDKPFKCNECGKCFNVKHNLTRHMMIHTEAKLFKCEECGKCFNVKENLNRHMRIHTGDNPFKCEECGKCFNMKQNLNRHMMIHWGQTFSV